MIDTINTIINELIERGEDANEMRFWGEIYSQLPDQEKVELRNNLFNELERIKKFQLTHPAK